MCKFANTEKKKKERSATLNYQKFCVRFDFKRKKKDKPSDEELKWLKEFLDRPDISYMNLGRKDHVYVVKRDGVKVYERKCYLLWKIRDLHEAENCGSGIQEAGRRLFF